MQFSLELNYTFISNLVLIEFNKWLISKSVYFTDKFPLFKKSRNNNTPDLKIDLARIQPFL
jgi:hypothetical protein